MSLQIWLPLTESLQNYGVLNTPTPTTDVAFATNGKIGGKCLKSNTKAVYDLSSSNISTHSMTVSFWGKADNYTGTSTKWWQLCSFTCDDATQFHIYCVPNVRYKMEYNPELNAYCNTEVWHHVTYVLNGTKLTAYIDGIENASATVTNVKRLLTSLSIGTNTVCINDFRIYNHCLTAREVKMLSQGLILHLPLHDQAAEATTNIAPYPTPGADATNTNPWDKVLHPNAINVSGWSVGYNGGVSANGTKNPQVGYHAKWELIDGLPTIVFNNLNSAYNSTGRWLGISSSGTSISSKLGANTTYTVSFDAKGSIDGMTINSGLYYQLTGASGSAFHDGQPSFTISTSWKRYSYTFTTKSNHTTAENAQIYIYGHYGIEGTSYVRNIQVELKDHATPYTPSTRTPIVQDCSGYGHHGTVVGSVITSTDSARYKSSIYIGDGRTNYLKTNTITMPSDFITMSCWMKTASTGYSGYHIPLSANADNYEMSVDSSGKLRTGFRIKGSRVVDNATNASVLDGKWHMLTTTYDGATIRRYVDGIEAGNATSTTGTLSGAETNFLVGNYNGTTYGNQNVYMSDVRVYATALAAADIKQLYEVSAFMTNNGSMFGYEYIEGSNGKIRMNKSGVIFGDNISELGFISNMRTKVLSDGSAWARIYWLNTKDTASFFANATEAAYCVNKTNRYSRMDMVDKFKTANGVYEFMLNYPTLSDTLYNRWQQTNSPNVAHKAGTGYVAITTAWNTHANPLTKSGSPGSAVWATNISDNWWSPIGQISDFSGGIPATDGSTQKEIELWVRIDNLPAITKISLLENRFIQAVDINEI